MGTDVFGHQRMVSAVRRVESVSDRMSYIDLRCRWCNILVLNVHAQTEGKNDSKSFYEELQQVFIIFSSTTSKFCYEILMQKWGNRVFSN